MANPETLRKASWARRWRDWLLQQLGGVCALCGSAEDLEVDHVDGRTWKLESKSQAGRIREYIKEFKAGVALRALCRSCNGGYNPYRR